MRDDFLCFAMIDLWSGANNLDVGDVIRAGLVEAH